jgi:hypothetical protein
MIHQAERGTLYEHYNDGTRYRVLFTTQPCDSAAFAFRYGVNVILNAALATNDAIAPYALVPVFYGLTGKPYASLPYEGTVYVSLTMGGIYIRETTEFHEGILTTQKDHNGDAIEISRFRLVNP